ASAGQLLRLPFLRVDAEVGDRAGDLRGRPRRRGGARGGGRRGRGPAAGRAAADRVSKRIEYGWGRDAMTAPTRTRGGSRLQRLARGSIDARDARDARAARAEEHCELCGAAVGEPHRHLLERDSRELLCVCRPCALLFDRDGAAAGRYLLVPERRLRLEGFALSDAVWEELRVPVDMAFFFHSTAAGRVLAYYPSPLGPTESQLPLEAWRELEHDNPVVVDLEADVEALLAD